MNINRNTKLDAALSYASAGWSVIPLHFPVEAGCSCGNESCEKLGKHPQIEKWPERASCNDDQIRSWWEEWPDANVGILTGAASGIFVLDVDPDHGGSVTLAALEEEFGALPETLEARTGGGGRHLVFNHPGFTIRNSQSTKLGAGLDVRGDRGLIVASPSAHESGECYQWVNEHQIVDAPDWLLDLLSTPRPTPTLVSDLNGAIREGQRNTELASIAGTLRRDGLDRTEILAALGAINEGRCDPPLPDSEVAEIAASIVRYEPAEAFSLQVYTAAELCSLPDPDGDGQLIGPLVVRGQRLIIAGQTGEGKTTIALQMISAFLHGEEFLGWKGQGGRVLILDAEQNHRTIKRRLREAGLDNRADLDVVTVADGLLLDSDHAHRAEIQRILAETDYDVVLFDPLYKLHGGDSIEERATVGLMRVLDRWREQYQFALILLAHVRKQTILKRSMTINDVFGSSAYVRGAEVVVGIQRTQIGKARLYFFKDRDGDLPLGQVWGLLFDRDNGGFQMDPEHGAPKPTIKDRVEEYMIEHREASINQLRDALKENGKKPTDRSVRDALKELGAERLPSDARANDKIWRLRTEDE